MEYLIEADENLTAEIPITPDITEKIGEYKAYIEISSDGLVLGKTTEICFSVLSSPSKGNEIHTRQTLYDEISRLNGELGEKENALELVKNALITHGVYITDSTDVDEYGNFILGLHTEDKLRNIIEGTITSIVIPQGITKINTFAFYGCSLTSVTIPPSVRTIEESAFNNCDYLTDLILSEGLVTIGHSAFSSCDSLREVVIPGTVESVKTYAFISCMNLERVVLSHGVERIETYAFAQNNRHITSLWLPNTLTSVSSPFYQSLSPNAVVTLENGFECNYFNLSEVSNASVDQIMSWLYALNDRTYRTTSYTLVIGSANLAKLTEQQIAFATSKNWNLT
jgi:hypothetical protein